MSILSLKKDHGFPREWHWKISPMSDGLRLAVAGILELRSHNQPSAL